MSTITDNQPKLYAEAADFMPLNGTDYVEMYVSNAKQAAHFFRTAMGFQPLAHAGLMTGLRDRESYVVVQDKIRIVFTTPLQSGTKIGEHLDKHGDGVKVTALWVDNATHAYNAAIERGATSYMEPIKEEDDHGSVVRSGIYTYGEVVHIFVERNNYNGIFLPGFEKWETYNETPSMGLKYIDHMVGNVAVSYTHLTLPTTPYV